MNNTIKDIELRVALHIQTGQERSLDRALNLSHQDRLEPKEGEIGIKYDTAEGSILIGPSFLDKERLVRNVTWAPFEKYGGNKTLTLPVLSGGALETTLVSPVLANRIVTIVGSSVLESNNGE